MFKNKKTSVCLAVFFFSVCMAAAWGGRTHPGPEDGGYSGQESQDINISRELSYKGSMELQFARQFSVDYYEGGYTLIQSGKGRRYLIIPEDREEPEDLNGEIQILKQPLDNIYLVATAVMDMFCQLDGLDSIRFSGQKADGWSLEEVQKKMEKGDILYAGRYDSPDYELIVSHGCSLAIENNMITHCPEAAEKLESFGIPVFIDLSSYESHPLGRVEWIKLYGVLLGREKEASEAFGRQIRMVEKVAGEEKSGKTVAFFYITANGMVSVRTPSDYIPSMIRLAGGEYVPDDLSGESHRSTMTMQMEEFYFAAKDADYLIYNSTIDGELKSVQELLEKEKLLEDFKAVQEGNVWCTERDLYQQPMSAGKMIEDIHNMLSGQRDRQREIQYLYQLK